VRLPVILIDGHKLGGISLTISAFEFFRIRGYDVELVLMFWEKSRQNYRFLAQYCWSRYRIPVGTVSLTPPNIRRRG
jgi:dethiobiotin synthetase/adenosylmethionine--8-amino-7-oxononanoate aminotransferase